ncbi:YbaY family lipoprotein [uncultured Pseudodesulfovibrio sp.]|uniref:YbaY family lipoprotein n=1 Tax=uncultured Pseudodesulfovibrio sp. TaxID=2035858 RepID=UPI0029C64EEC|nr:YbaY family lipoprotein [uncultured Pseudodesulfovibrio sp.]
MRWSLIALLAIVTISALPCGGCKASGTSTIQFSTLETRTYYRERIMLPPGSMLTVTFEDVSRMDVPATILAKETLTLETAPPYSVELKYDPATIDARARYAVRARIEFDGSLLFINTHHIDPFAAPSGAPVEILVQRVKQ